MGNYTEGFTSVSGDVVDAAELETEFDSIATAVNSKVDSDGSTTMTGALNMGSNKITNVTDPTSDQDAATKAYADSSNNPTGTIQMFGSTTPPTGWLLCDGSAVSRTTYAALFAVISTTFGSGDGSTTFNLPDMGGRVAAGYKSSGTTLTTPNQQTMAATGGSQTMAHTHTFSGTTGSEGSGGSISGSPGTAFTQPHDHSFSGTTSGASNTLNVQPTIILPFIIKT